jgi:teichuronic acid exporter
MNSLKKNSLNSFYWSFLDSFGSYFIRFGFTISIARILDPSDYGLIGMILIFLGLGTLLSEGGFSMALIQKKNITNIDYSTVFYFNLAVSIIVYLILFFSAQYIADFYKEEILINVIRVSALTLVIGTLSTIQTVILSKELNFKKQTQISWIATLGSGLTGIIIAYNGFAVWALVYMTLSFTLIKTSALWLFSSWRPLFAFDCKSFKSLFLFGSKIFVSGLSDLFFNKMYYPLIGKNFNSQELGFYTNASSFSEIIVKQITIAFGRVSFPLFSSINSDIPRMSRTFTTLFHSISFFMFLITIISIVSTHSFVMIFLTSKWLPSVSYMKLFLIEGFFFTLYILNQNTIAAIGLSGLILKIEIFRKFLLLTSLLVLFKYGISALIIGQLISSFITFLISTHYTQKKLDLKIFPLFSELTKLILITFLIYVIDKFFLEIVIDSAYILLCVKILFLPVMFLFLAYLLKSKGLDHGLILIKESSLDKLKL